MTDNPIASPARHFRGRSEHSLDGKGRLNIPTRFREILREHYDERLMVTPWHQCLRVYPVAQWEELERNLLANRQSQPHMGKMIRYMLGGVVECPLDRQGRILLSPKLREEGGLGGREVVITGVMTYFEVLDKQTWEANNRPTAADFADFEVSLLKSGLL